MSALGNRRAFLEGVLAGCEGTQGEEGYRALFGWKPGNGMVFTSFADHPRIFFDYTQKDGTVVRTSAAGKYQATWTTWQDFIRERGPHDFTPASQDEFALWLIKKCGALDDVDRGRLRAAIDKCGGRWASLPSATVPQPRRTYAFCEREYLAAGGVLEGAAPSPVPQPPRAPGATTQPAATHGEQPFQREEPRMPIPALAIGLGLAQTLLPQILNLFSARAQATIAEKTGADPQVARDFVNGVISMAGQQVGVPVTDDKTAIAAVGKFVTEVAPGSVPAKELEEQSLDYLHDLTAAMREVVDVYRQEVEIERADRKAASDQANAGRAAGEVDQAPTLVRAALALLGLLVLFTFAVALVQICTLPTRSPTTEVWAAITGLIGFATGVVATIYAYRFGTSKGSGAKDLLISEQLRHERNAARGG